MESFICTKSRLGGSFAFGTALMEPILAGNGDTLLTYLGKDAATRSPYDTLYKDMVVTFIMTKNCRYDIIRKWPAQQYTGPNGKAYPNLSNDLEEMMSSENFQPDSFKSRSKRYNWNKNINKQNVGKENETVGVGAVIEPAPIIPSKEQDQTEDVPDSDNEKSIKDDLEVSILF